MVGQWVEQGRRAPGSHVGPQCDADHLQTDKRPFVAQVHESGIEFSKEAKMTAE